MIGILYILICVFVGKGLVRRFLPNLTSGVRVIAGFLIGTLLVTWLVYGLSYFADAMGAAEPMTWANVVVIVVFSLLFLFLLSARWPRYQKLKPVKMNWLEIGLIAFLIGMSAIINFGSFYISRGVMHLGLSVFSDFGPHLSMIRSFSLGDNFPSQYPHFPNGEMRYHFMFQFLVGNLEYLGLRIDWAFNLMSSLSLISLGYLLFHLAAKISKRRSVGLLTVFLFFFRSSWAFFTNLNGVKGWGQFVSRVFSSDKFIGLTAHEDWGLWNMNVLANQRHLTFALGVMLVFLLVIVRKFEIKRTSLRKNLKQAVFLGIMLGLLSYWNAAVVIALILVLSVFAVFTKNRRIEFGLIIGIGAVITILLKQVFVGGGDAVKPEWFFGFLAEDKSVVGILKYYSELLGVFPVVVLIGLVLLRKRRALVFFLAAILPFLFANLIKLTIDVPVGHKYIFISVMLLNIFVAFTIDWLFRTKWWSLAILLLFLVTCTGVVDMMTLMKKNSSVKALTYQVNDPLHKWVVKNTPKDAVFLSDRSYLNQILLAGRKIFYGWPYYAWSAGYDMSREDKVITMFTTTDPSERRRLLNENKIGYIYVDEELRNEKWVKIREDLIEEEYEVIFESMDSKKARIYSVSDSVSP